MAKNVTRQKVSQIYDRLTTFQKVGLGMIFVIGLFALAKTYESTTYAFFSYETTLSRLKNKNVSLPTFVNIPSVEIELPIDETAINHGIWGLSNDGASHLASSPVPGEKGNTVLYAKNTPQEFGRLTSLQKGDTIIVVTQDGTPHEYEVTDRKIVSPTDATLIDNTRDETLTLYTPYGFADLKRFVVTAKPTSSE